MPACLALVLALLLPAAVAAQTITVHVTRGGSPVADARVTSGEQTVRTNALGLAVLEVSSLPMDIVVAPDEFVTETIRVSSLPKDGRVDVAFDAPPTFEEEIVVNAARSPTRIQDQPLRVEVIDREEIEEKALMTPGSVAMLIGETSGLRVQPTAPSLGAANVRIQGLRGRYSQMLADGLPLYGGQGDSFSLLQVPPLDLGQVEIIKGAASALYGASALGGVINLVSRRPTEPGREVLLNLTSLGGSDATVWLADTVRSQWTWTLLGGFHRQGRRDLDDDGWTDVAGYERGMVRPRLFYSDGAGTTAMVTGGVIGESRRGGTLDDRVAPDGAPFEESLDTSRGDAGGVMRWVAGSSGLMSIRGSFSLDSQDRVFGDARERGTRSTGFGEFSLQGMQSRHTWVVGGAYQYDGYNARDLPIFDYGFHTPAVFAQDEFGAGPVRVSLSGRIDIHSEYGTLASPRGSLLWRPDSAWSVRMSAGGGAFAPTPFVEDTDETGLSRVAPLEGLEAERAWGGSVDVTRRVGGLELTGTVFASDVQHPVQARSKGPTAGSCLSMLVVPLARLEARRWAVTGQGPFLVVATYAYVQSRELDEESGLRREVPLTPQALRGDGRDVGGGGVGTRRSRAVLRRAAVSGGQPLSDAEASDSSSLERLVEKRFDRVRLFVNAENLGNVRQTSYDPLVRPDRHPDGRWTVDAWAPLDGRVINGGVRVFF